MKKLIKFSLIFAGLVILGISACMSKVQAKMQSESKVEVNVDFQQNASSEVNYKIRLVNKSKDYFIKEYAFQINYFDISDIRVFENGEPANFLRDIREDGTRIRIILKKRLIKKGDSVTLQISFQTYDYFRQDGNLKKVFVPIVKTDEKLKSITYKVSFPAELGEPIYNSLIESKFNSKDGRGIIEYGQKAASSGALFMFGSKQMFEIEYHYSITDDEKFTITLPPDSSSQLVEILEVSHIPHKAYSDLDGNNVLEYKNLKGEKLYVRIYLTRDYDFSTLKLSHQNYLGEENYWDFEDAGIQKLKDEINMSDKSTTKAVYDYLLTNFKTSQKNTERMKASELLQNTDTKLSCQNMNDLFISLLRANGIPARSAVGYINTNDSSISDELSYWTEAYVEEDNRWTSFDICYESKTGYNQFNKKFLDRLIFAYRGLSSTKPEVLNPFKEYNDNTKVIITPVSYERSLPDGNNYELAVNSASKDLLTKQSLLTLQVKNKSAFLLKVSNIKINGQKVKLSRDFIEGNLIQSVFPGQEVSYQIELGDLYTQVIDNKQENSYSLELIMGSSSFSEGGSFEVSDEFTIKDFFIWIFSIILSAGLFYLAYRILQMIKEGKLRPIHTIKQLSSRLAFFVRKLIQKYKNRRRKVPKSRMTEIIDS